MCEVMVRKMGACEECERTCQLLHGCKRDLDPMVSRFFKVMIGTDFNEALVCVYIYRDMYIYSCLIGFFICMFSRLNGPKFVSVFVFFFW